MANLIQQLGWFHYVAAFFKGVYVLRQTVPDSAQGEYGAVGTVSAADAAAHEQTGGRGGWIISRVNGPEFFSGLFLCSMAWACRRAIFAMIRIYSKPIKWIVRSSVWETSPSAERAKRQPLPTWPSGSWRKAKR